MALTDYSNLELGGEGNLIEETNYYNKDLKAVFEQKDCKAIISVNCTLKRVPDEPLTVLVGLDEKGEPLSKVALPCPPYYIEDRHFARPGKMIFPVKEKKV